MQSISFIFNPGLSSERQRTVLKELEKWDEITKASQLRPESNHPDISRMANVYPADDADLTMLVRKLNELPEIESASVPPRRRLI